MIVVPITFKYIEIAKFSRDDSTILICFDDGSKDIFLEKHESDMSNVDEFVNTVVAETRNLVKQNNAKNSGGVLGDVVSVRFTEDEETLYERLRTIFSRIKDDLKRAKATKVADNYLQTIANLQGAKFNI